MFLIDNIKDTKMKATESSTNQQTSEQDGKLVDLLENAIKQIDQSVIDSTISTSSIKPDNDSNVNNIESKNIEPTTCSIIQGEQTIESENPIESEKQVESEQPVESKKSCESEQVVKTQEVDVSSNQKSEVTKNKEDKDSEKEDEEDNENKDSEKENTEDNEDEEDEEDKEDNEDEEDNEDKDSEKEDKNDEEESEDSDVNEKLNTYILNVQQSNNEMPPIITILLIIICILNIIRIVFPVYTPYNACGLHCNMK